MNLHAGPMQLAATSLILVSPFTKFALTLEPVARGVEEFAQKVSFPHTVMAEGSLGTAVARVYATSLVKLM